MTCSTESDGVDAVFRVADRIRGSRPAEPNPWQGSPFEWIKGLTSAGRGKVGQQIVQVLLSDLGLSSGPSVGSGSDIMVGNSRVEVKMSTLWKAGTYKFQQIRDQDYHFLICLGLSPFSAHMWVFEKDALFSLRGSAKGFAGQHTGKAALDTLWLTIDPENPYPWLEPFGGDIDAALKKVRNLAG